MPKLSISVNTGLLLKLEIGTRQISGTPVSSKRLGPYTSPKVVTLSVSKEINNEPTLKQDPELEPPHVRRPSATRFDVEMLSVPDESLSETSDYTSVDLNLGL
ncbi:hypothetical protein U1Q18_008897 [Sarracenia purpurea var. burkii]